MSKTEEMEVLLSKMKKRKERLIELKDKVNTDVKTAESSVQAVVDAKIYFYQQLWFQNLPRLFIATSPIFKNSCLQELEEQMKDHNDPATKQDGEENKA